MRRQTWIKTVEEIKKDNISGAVSLIIKGCDLIIAHIESGGDKKDAYEISRKLVDAQPSMAPFYNLRDIIIKTDDILSSVRSFKDKILKSREKMVNTSLSLLSAKKKIFTYSASFSVEKLLEKFDGEIIILESRPVTEGKLMAERLHSAGKNVILTTDMGMSYFLDEVDAFVSGADVVSNDFIVNKCGTRLLTEVCFSRGIPIYILADSSKFYPLTKMNIKMLSKRIDEVYDGDMNIRVVNPYYDKTPLDIIDNIISDEGIMTKNDVINAIKYNTYIKSLLA